MTKWKRFWLQWLNYLPMPVVMMLFTWQQAIAPAIRFSRVGVCMTWAFPVYVIAFGVAAVASMSAHFYLSEDAVSKCE